jgi:hypothetical protein
MAFSQARRNAYGYMFILNAPAPTHFPIQSENEQRKACRKTKDADPVADNNLKCARRNFYPTRFEQRCC